MVTELGQSEIADLLWGVTMANAADRPEALAAIRTDLGAIFISLELSRSTWLVEQGWGLAFRRYSTRLVATEEAARAAERGL
jgi:transposase